ncbi:MAG: glycosyltransferase [Chitinivibrionales bacterium]|nr:glycosyltransferase [Chitinivibrionales bacterium]
MMSFSPIPAPTAILAGLLLAYSMLIVRLLIAVLRRGVIPVERGTALPGVSVIIAFKDEELRLTDCLKTLAAQKYPGDVEIVLVNDGSRDEYRRAINAGAESMLHKLKLVDSHYSDHEALTSKQQALDCGVNQARNEWLVFTDADMVFETDWLQHMMRSAAQTQADVVFGHTAMLTASRATWWHPIERWQLAFLNAIAFAFNRAGFAGSCMGNNLAMRATCYQVLGGQRGIGYSLTEDRALYLRAFKMKMNVQHCMPFLPKARTYPSAGLAAWIRQMLRWAKGGFGKLSLLLPIGVLSFVQLLLTGLAPAIHLPALLENLVLVNFMVTWLLVALAFVRIGTRSHALLFPLYCCVLILESVCFIFVALFIRSTKWKSRHY